MVKNVVQRSDGRGDLVDGRGFGRIRRVLDLPLRRAALFRTLTRSIGFWGADRNVDTHGRVAVGLRFRRGFHALLPPTRDHAAVGLDRLYDGAVVE